MSLLKYLAKYILLIFISLLLYSHYLKPKNTTPKIDADYIINSYLKLCYLETHFIDNISLELELNELMVKPLAQATYDYKRSEELGAGSIVLKNTSYIYRYDLDHFKVYLSFDLFVYGECVGRVVTDLRINEGGKIFEEELFMLGNLNSH